LSAPPSSFKSALRSLAHGALLEAEGPFGDFVLDDDRRPVVLIAGGIGITPFRSMLAELAKRGQPRDVTLLYSNASADFPFRAFLDSQTAARVVYTVTRPSPAWDGPTGRIDVTFIAQHAPHAATADVYVCGPSAMVDGMHTLLRAGGLEPARIHAEGFPGYEAAVAAHA